MAQEVKTLFSKSQGHEFETTCGSCLQLGSFVNLHLIIIVKWTGGLELYVKLAMDSGHPRTI